MVESSKEPQEVYEDYARKTRKTNILSDMLFFKRYNGFKHLVGLPKVFWDFMAHNTPPISVCHLHQEPGECPPQCEWQTFYAAYRSFRESTPLEV